MSIVLAILGKYWPLIVAATIGGAIAGWTVHGLDGIELRRQQNAMTSYRAQVADAELAAQTAAREALQEQIDARHAADIHNQQVMNDLRQKNADVESHFAADRDAIRGLLDAASRQPAGRCEVPEAHSQPGTAPASREEVVGRVSEICAGLAAEDERNGAKLNALNSELDGKVDP